MEVHKNKPPLPRRPRSRRRGWLTALPALSLSVGFCVLGAGGAQAATPSAYAVTGTIATVGPGPFGPRPYGVAFDPGTGDVYDADLGGSLVVSDPVTDAVTATIPLDQGSVSVADDPVSGTLYVANQDEGVVYVINAATNAITATMTTGEDAEHVAIATMAGSGTAYVTNFLDGTVAVINEATNTVSAYIPVGAFPEGIAADPVTGKVYVSHQQTNTVSVIDAATNAVTATIPVGATPQEVAADPATGKVYVANSASNTVSVIDESTDTVTATIPVGGDPSALAIDPITGTVYVAGQGSADLDAIDEATDTVAVSAPLGCFGTGVAVNPGTGAVYVSCSFNGTVSVFSSSPQPPSGASATAGNAQASVAFTPPARDGGSAVTSYVVTATDATNPANGGQSASGGASPVTVAGLTNGDSYTFTVTAANAVGASAASGPTTAVTPVSVPDAPVIGIATPGNGQATVAFTPPANDEGSPVTSYVVTATDATSPANGGQTAAGTGSPVTVTGLTNGDSYTFTVTATSAVGTSAASGPSTAVTPATVPGAPVIGTATPGNGQATVAFTPPASDGGLPVASYAVTATDVTNPANGGQTASGAAGPVTVAGLTNGDSYTFTVAAINDAGTGPASAASAAVTPATVPGAPGALGVVAGNGQAIVSFGPPTDDGGSPVTGYTVTATDATNPASGGQTAAGAASPVTVTGLTNGDSYTFSVTAENSVGTGPASATSVAATPLTIPGVPGDVAVVAGNRQVTVSFSPPTDDGGAVITGYTVTATDATNPANGGQTVTGAGSPVTVTGLTNGDSYTFTVTATNAAGTGETSSPSMAVTPATVPDAPANVTVAAGDGQATVSFSPPADDGGAVVTSYTVTATDATNPANGGQTVTGTGSPVTVTGLTNGDSYTFTVTATNRVGTGPASTASAPATPAPVCTTTITGVHKRALTVSSGLTCLVNAAQSGSITVAAGAALSVTNSTVNGSVTATSPASITYCGSTEAGGLNITGATGAVMLGGSTPAGACAADTVNGSVTISGTTGPVTISGLTQAGSLTLSGNAGGVDLSSAQLKGSAEVQSNTGTAPVTVSANTIAGSLYCAGNTPAPADNGTVSTVTGSGTGQCAGLAIRS